MSESRQGLLSDIRQKTECTDIRLTLWINSSTAEGTMLHIEIGIGDDMRGLFSLTGSISRVIHASP